jgi:hypothetical protein
MLESRLFAESILVISRYFRDFWSKFLKAMLGKPFGDFKHYSQTSLYESVQVILDRILAVGMIFTGITLDVVSVQPSRFERAIAFV